MTEPTPAAVEAATRAIEREERTSDLDGHALREAMARAALTAAAETQDATTRHVERVAEAVAKATPCTCSAARAEGARWKAEAEELQRQLDNSHADVDCIRGYETKRADRAEAQVQRVRALADSMDRDAAVILREAGDAGLSYANCTSMDARAIRAALDGER